MSSRADSNVMSSAVGRDTSSAMALGVGIVGGDSVAASKQDCGHGCVIQFVLL